MKQITDYRLLVTVFLDLLLNSGSWRLKTEY